MKYIVLLTCCFYCRKNFFYNFSHLKIFLLSKSIKILYLAKWLNMIKGMLMRFKYKRVALDEIFFALSDPTRRRILELLLKKGMYASQISNQFAFTMPTISRHLKTLSDCRLISKKKEAQKIKYFIQAESLTQAQIWIETLGGATSIDYDKLEKLLCSLQR